MNTKEFAKLCGVEKRTLFYYDELGILKPASVHENGYREYAPEQLGEMDMIKLLQASGYTLREIGAILHGGTETRRERFFSARGLIDEKIAVLLDMKNYISRKERLLEEYLAACRTGEEYKIRYTSLAYTEKKINEDSHFFSFSSDGSYDSAILDAGGTMSAYREDPHGLRKEGRALTFFLEISLEEDMLNAIKNRLDEFRFAGESRYFVNILPGLLVEKDGCVVMKVTVFE